MEKARESAQNAWLRSNTKRVTGAVSDEKVYRESPSFTTETRFTS